ncbi:NAD(P)H-dependent oxidoreductase [Oceanobacillus sp. CFH 90083]|uniref:NAD(P)H-dependent oxidoreductase n=1 Tax=Oceanobacillus sp. CFH 90083 TaxID=2592336 RepID=UPI00128D3C0F|nr:NAD(P)H-dependent oxidoreductase [Oceanobacillus sp. CFH 90083]
MKTLIVVGHPNLSSSVINKKWIEELKKYPDLFTVHELSTIYPDEKFDVKKEQNLIMEHENLILQFPIYWFNGPSILKKWLDEVLTEGWAFGNTGDNLTRKKIALAVSVGSKNSDYRKGGRYKYTMKDILAPFEITIKYCKADYKSYYSFYGTEFSTQNEINKSAKDYVEFLKNII